MLRYMIVTGGDMKRSEYSWPATNDLVNKKENKREL